VGARAGLLGEDALKRKRTRSAYAAPPEALTLREVVAQLVAQSRQLHALDDAIGRKLAAFEHAVRSRRPSGHPVDVPFPPWGKLGWSGRRGHWRLVVVDEEACADLAAMPRSCRTDACLVLRRLVDRLDLLPAR
jgi:hypothetical protein